MKRTITAIYFSLIFTGIISCKKEAVQKPEVEIKEEAKLDESIPAVIPHIYIDVADGQEITSKEDYLTANIKIEGNGKFPDLSVSSTSIKGRGNSTWPKPKKPYRLKLDQKTSILGLPSAKNWVLLANYQDYTLMTNATAMKIGQQLGLPFTNSIISVDLTINGVYKGNYNITQQIEIQEGRVNVGDGGVILELDEYFDEEFKFRSANFNLPVMIKEPGIKSEAQFNNIKNEFQAFENLLAAPDFPNNNYGSVFDKKQLVNYLIVNNLTGNMEIKHPKSVYIHKAAGGKYTMGPVWDFDWGFGLDENSRVYFGYTTKPLFSEDDNGNGTKFFTKFLSDPEIKSLYKQQWKNYRDNNFNDLMKYIETFAAEIRESQKKDFEIWKVGDNNLPKSKADLKTYLRKRASYIDNYVKSL